MDCGHPLAGVGNRRGNWHHQRRQWLLLKPFPVKAQERLLVVWTSKPERGFALAVLGPLGTGHAQASCRHDQRHGCHPYAGVLTAVLHLDDGSAMPVQRTAVTGEWFDVLGVPSPGRLLTAADDQVGAPTSWCSRAVWPSACSEAHQRRSAAPCESKSTRSHRRCDAVDFDYPRTAEAWVPAVQFRDTPEVLGPHRARWTSVHHRQTPRPGGRLRTCSESGLGEHRKAGHPGQVFATLSWAMCGPRS